MLSRRSESSVPCFLGAIAFQGHILASVVLMGSFLSAFAQVIPQKPPVSRTPSGESLYSIEGRVVAQSDVSPVQGARVTLLDFKGVGLATSMTDDEGTFIFYDLPTGSYTLAVSHPGFAEQSERVDLSVGSQRGLRLVLSRDSRAVNALPGPAVPVWALQIPPEAQKAYGKGIKELQKGEKNKSIPHFQAAVQLYPQYATAYSALGAAHLGLGERNEATVAFENGLKIDENLPDACMGLGALYNAQKRYGEAEKLLLRARLLKPEDWRIHYELGEAYWGAGNWARAEESLRRAKELRAGFPRLYLLLINVLALQNKHNETLTAMEDFLRLFPQNSFAQQVRQKRDHLKRHLQKEPALEQVTKP